ncbi:MAG: hypothetical protein ND866_27975, partial [Pyrinomonadaceae bacterium]|nr:hypothetical protein [Pyrinomonadaceae bacterium]
PSGGAGAIPEKALLPDPLVNLLVSKGLLTTEEARDIVSGRNPENQRDRLATLLREKGLISGAEFDALRATAPNAINANAAAASAEPMGARVSSAAGPSTTLPRPQGPAVIAAVAPIRLLPIEAPQREGLIPDLKLGSGARIKPYGYFKTSVIRDSSSPGGMISRCRCSRPTRGRTALRSFI